MVDRLSREDWVGAGLSVLASDGHLSLRPERLAKRLGVSRGSFYWHFADVGAFERAVVEQWAVVAVEDPYAQATTGRARQPAEALAALIGTAFRAPDPLERAMRA